MLGWRVAVAW